MTTGRHHVVIAGAGQGHPDDDDVTPPVGTTTRSVDLEERTVYLDDGTQLRVRLAAARTR